MKRGGVYNEILPEPEGFPEQGWLFVSSKADFAGHTKEAWDNFAGDGLLLQTLDFAENA